MFLFDLLFGNKKGAGMPAVSPAETPAASPAAAERAASAPGTRIFHDPALIAGFKSDHRLLLEIFGAIAAGAREGNLAEVQQRLGHFRTILMDHLLKENVRLYIYLEHMLKGDPASYQLIHEFRHEMDGIGQVVVGFLGKYKAIASQPALAAEFSRDLDAIGAALAARIEREEKTLYPMYAPPA